MGLLDILTAQGVQGTKRTTLREYNEPTIELYKGGGVRIRGVEGVDNTTPLVFTFTENGIKLFTAASKEQAREIAKKLNLQVHCSEVAGDVNIKSVASIKFFNHIEEHDPAKVEYKGDKAVARDKLSVSVEEDTTIMEWSK